MNRKYFGLQLHVLSAFPSKVRLATEAAEKERIYGLCNKT